MGDPPSSDGVPHTTVAVVLPGDAATLVGAPGTVAGTTGLDGSESGPTPEEVIAATLNVYVVPLVSPLTVSESAGLLNVWALCAEEPI